MNSSIHYQPLEFIDWGLVDYQQALDQQMQLVEKVIAQPEKAYLIFCTHPPVVTLGRATRAEDVFAWSGETLSVARGGRATYHGPSQLVVYPILNLKFPRHQRGPQEITGYLRDFEKAIVQTLQHYGVQAVGKTLKTKAERDALAATASLEDTGVWVGQQKIASLGIGVKLWTTYHGAAINLQEDEKAFQGLNPCGYTSQTMISLEKLLGHPIDIAEFKNRLKENLLRSL
ncbi:MAG: lipoyl(octanoyl) transferase LipB [Pseudobdellovibrionaceae bacterium]